MSGWEFSHINRRMHNKLFVADNVAAVAGGRNMADEYVMNAKGRNFVDMDVFAGGRWCVPFKQNSITTGTAMRSFWCATSRAAA